MKLPVKLGAKYVDAVEKIGKDKKVKRPVLKMFIVAIGVVIMLITGCAEQEPPDMKKSRLIAAENLELKKQLEQHNKEIEKIKQMHEESIKEQQKLLADCLQEKDSWKNKSQQKIREQVDRVLDAVMEQNAKLREENEKLKEQIEQLQTQVQQLEKKLEDLIPKQPRPLE